MATLFSTLPKPKASVSKSKWAADSDDEDEKPVVAAPRAPARKGPPAYGQRRGWTPIKVEVWALPPKEGPILSLIRPSFQDFGDGGAFPEIHITQYPLDMGRKRSSNTRTSETLPLQTDAEGNLRYDLILRQGRDDKQIVHGQYKDMLEKDIKDDEELTRPDEEVINETTERTRQALEKIMEGRLSAAAPKLGGGGDKSSGPSYMRYTPASANGSTRIIRMVEAPIDPLDPPKFKHKKVPVGPPSPPPPVLHSPPRKVTAEEQKNWVIPPCISNWKNAKGYTIPLDKRLAADGRGVQDVQINDNFAKLSEALFIADRHAREEVKIRGEMQAKLAEKEKQEKEEKLRLLAQRAREERAGLVSGGGVAESRREREEEEEEDSEAESEAESLGEEDVAQVREREKLRRERAKQREREIRMSHMGQETKQRVLSKRYVEHLHLLESFPAHMVSVLQFSGERDISEKIALGLAQPTVSKESMFDQRLFNQDAGLSSGFGAEDSYNLYDKPLFNGSASTAIYRPKRGEEDNNIQGVKERVDRLLGEGAPHRGFAGTEGGGGSSRDGPVQFEREQEDVFGLEEFMNTAKRGRDKDGERSDRSPKRRRD
ncbi:mRNA splicing protein [Rhizophlyctis rosea]|uniref:Pre-mRNA-processing protein 45 n=1 Tax=Rhizophlyctis rosea TaxID=64517 RepID=A0AAD5SK38_9FUNG|nr:mRNA splicing protein [Rhizophlyctis rosea]